MWSNSIEDGFMKMPSRLRSSQHTSHLTTCVRIAFCRRVERLTDLLNKTDLFELMAASGAIFWFRRCTEGILSSKIQ